MADISRSKIVLNTPLYYKISLKVVFEIENYLWNLNYVYVLITPVWAGEICVHGCHFTIVNLSLLIYLHTEWKNYSWTETVSIWSGILSKYLYLLIPPLTLRAPVVSWGRSYCLLSMLILSYLLRLIIIGTNLLEKRGGLSNIFSSLVIKFFLKKLL